MLSIPQRSTFWKKEAQRIYWWKHVLTRVTWVDEAPWGCEPPAVSWQSEDTVTRATSQAICAFYEANSSMCHMCHKRNHSQSCGAGQRLGSCAMWDYNLVHMYSPSTAMAPLGTHQHKQSYKEAGGGGVSWLGEKKCVQKTCNRMFAGDQKIKKKIK